MLEDVQVCGAQGISLSDNRDKVDAGAQALHHFDIKGLQGVSSWPDKVQAGMDTEVDFVDTAGLLLLQHVGLVLVVEKFDNRHPGVTVVDIVAETRGINDGQTNYRRFS